MFLYLMVVVSAFIVGRTVRDTLYLHRVSLDTLPLMYILVAGAVGIASYAYSQVADRLRRDLLIQRTLLLFSIALAGLWLLLTKNWGGGWVYPVLYASVEIIGAISIIQFWTFANDIFSSRQAKRLFGVIGAGGVLANIVCGFAIGSITPLIGSENLVAGCALLLATCILLVRAAAAQSRGDLEVAARRTRETRLGPRKASGRIFQSRHLRIIAVMVVVTFLTVSLVDFQFKIFARRSFSEEAQLAAFFGYFYGIAGIVASGVQFFVTGRLLERSGIVVALAVLPLSILVGVLGMLLFPVALFAVTLAKGAEVIFRYTINDATMNLLYIPVPSQVRGRAKAFIDGILKPASIGLSGLFMLAFGRWFGPEMLATHLAYLDIALLAAWIALLASIRSEYVKSLIETLRARRLNPNEVWSPVVDDATRRVLQSRLRSDDQAEILQALEIVPALDIDLSAEIQSLLMHDSNEVRIRALSIIGQSGRTESLRTVRRLMDEPFPPVRATAVRAYCALGRERAIRAVIPHLADGSIEVQAAAAASLIRYGGLDGILTAAEVLKRLLEGEHAEQRLYGARILGEIRVQSFFSPVVKLLADEDRRVRLAAIEAAGAMRSTELVPPLLYSLRDAVLGPAAARALIGYGPQIDQTLVRVLANPCEDIRIRRRAPRILGRIGGVKALNALLQALDSGDPELRVHAAWAAARIREKNPEARVDDTALDQAIRREIQGAYQALATISDLDLARDHLLPEALDVRHRRRLHLAFRLLEIRYPARTIQLVYANLDSDNRAVRANALEVVDNVLAKDEARLLLPLLEDQSHAERVRAGTELFALERSDEDGWLTRLLNDADPWVVSCTLFRIGERDLVMLTAAVTEKLRASDPIVRETACLTLTRLVAATDGLKASTRETLRGLATEIHDAATGDLRRASEVLKRSL